MFVGALAGEEFLAGDTHSNLPRDYLKNLARFVGAVRMRRIHVCNTPLLLIL